MSEKEHNTIKDSMFDIVLSRYLNAYTQSGDIERIKADELWKKLGNKERFNTATPEQMKSLLDKVDGGDEDGLAFSRHMLDLVRKTDVLTSENGVQCCELCGKKLKWSPSGKGKHVIGSCPSHGFVAIREHPIMKYFDNELPLKRPPGLLTRFFRAIF